MKALSLTQPWAILIAIGAKRIETRSWGTAYRGPLAIHASKTFPAWAKDCAGGSSVFRGALGWPDLCGPLTQEWIDDISTRLKALPLGAVIAICRLVGCKLIMDSELKLGPCADSARMLAPPEPELFFGDYTPGRYAWILEDVAAFPQPIPAKGALGLWEWSQMPEVSCAKR